MNTHTPGPWTIGKNGRLQTVANAVGGCEVIVDEDVRSSPHKDTLLRAPIAPKLAEALRAITNLADARLPRKGSNARDVWIQEIAAARAILAEYARP